MKVYEAPIANTSTAGVVKPDGTSITATDDGTLSVQAVAASKVTGLTDQIAAAKSEATEDAKQYTDENAVLTSDISIAAPSGDTPASDAKVVSEKLFIDSMTWKTTM